MPTRPHNILPRLNRGVSPPKENVYSGSIHPQDKSCGFLERSYKNTSGEILIGVIISLGIFTILSAAIITLVLSAYDLISYTRARTTAAHIASAQIELIRNLEFDDIGTQGGIPPGILKQSDFINRNGLTYNLKTSVIYIDDPFDDVAPADLLPNDFKRVRVDVSWGGIAASRTNTITLISDVAPKGIETVIGGGTIAIQVFDANTLPVMGANAHITSMGITPPVDLNLETDQSGRIILPGAPACNNCYHIEVSKEGFTSARTYSIDEIANPDKADLTVLVSGLTEIFFNIDRTSSLTLATVSGRDQGFAPLPGATLHLRGEKVLGTDALDQPVYEIDQDVTTGPTGTFTLENIGWDTYYLTLPVESTFHFSGLNPWQPFPLLPGEEKTVYASLSSQSGSSLLTYFVNNEGSPIASVSATLIREGEGSPEATVVSGLENAPDWGQSFFANLAEAIYSLMATAEGYLDYSSGSISVSGNKLEKIILDQE